MFAIIKVGGDKLTFHYRHRKALLIGASLIVLIVLSTTFCYFQYGRSSSIENDTVDFLATNTKEDQTPKEEEPVVQELYYVDVKGYVANPGLYQLPKGSRVMDALMAAGGVLENGDLTVLNLGKKIYDEMVIVVYSQEEVANFTQTKELEELRNEACQNQVETPNDACIEEDAASTTTTKVSINEATLEEFMSLPGIGESKAQEIIHYREEHGPFENIEEIQEVPGIGEALFAKIKDLIIL